MLISSVYAWGANRKYQLGLGNKEDTPYPREMQHFEGKYIVDIAVGAGYK